MNPVTRLIMELRQLRACLTPGDFKLYIYNMVTKAPSLIKQKTLAPIDHSMTGHVPFDLMGTKIIIPLDEIWDALASHDQTTTFGGAREMYAHNVYLRGFKKGIKANTVVDLGSNRGLFLILAAKVLEAELGVGVEPEEYYAPVFKHMMEANKTTSQKFRRIYKFASAVPKENSVTMREIMNEYDIKTIDFLKCDIEGGEFEVFLSNNEFLQNVSNIAMELHPLEGDVSQLVNELEKYKFDVKVTDQFGVSINNQDGHYLYASRIGSLVCN